MIKMGGVGWYLMFYEFIKNDLLRTVGRGTPSGHSTVGSKNGADLWHPRIVVGNKKKRVYLRGVIVMFSLLTVPEE